ncbi:MAG: hypothetical protein J0L82_15485 [Deltaproteobacteria bacterium]|nr:hypothetical protein [Deltaproteobacteria bacterium]
MKNPQDFQDNDASKNQVESNRDARTNGDADSDVVSFWLLLLFIATFFGIAAEEARRPSMFQSSGISAGHSAPNPIAFSIDGTPLPKGAGDQRTHMARRFDLSSVDPATASSNMPGKLEIPATGK